MGHIFYQFCTWLIEAGISASAAQKLACVLTCVVDIVAAVLIFYILNKLVTPVVKKLTEKTPTKVDDILFRQKFIYWVWWLLSALFLRFTLPHTMPVFAKLTIWCVTIMKVVVIGFATKAIVEFVKGIFLVVFDHDRVDEEARKLRLAAERDEDYEYVPTHSLQGLQQMLCLVIGFIGVLLMVAVLLGKSPLILISGLGAGAAVLMLVFKDSILGVVAGVQISAHDMLRPGDWIVAPKYGANGIVQEVKLATVKVLNYDHTIVTIPPYNLITESFQNWRHMEDTGGRRVMRSVNIDISSIRFMSGAELDSFRDEPWAQGLQLDEGMVNLTLFRRYLEHYITTRSTFVPRMLHMVRELEPTPHGQPVEIYFFTSKTSWKAYEEVMAGLMDHVFATVPRFGLRVFQAPSGSDIRTAIPSAVNAR